MWQRAVVEVDKKDILGERCEQVECPRLENCLCPSQNDSVSILGSSVAEKEREKRKKRSTTCVGQQLAMQTTRENLLERGKKVSTSKHWAISGCIDPAETVIIHGH